tara:strand:+ start:1211 stop:1498 length:288 start_codon:yes stop_codon:yes gene_type:complete
MFKSTINTGFHMTFENGIKISVQWGPGNYCDNYGEFFNPLDRDVKSRTAEIAIFKGNKFHQITEHDTVLGRQTPNEVAEWIRKASHPDFKFEVER